MVLVFSPLLQFTSIIVTFVSLLNIWMRSHDIIFFFEILLFHGSPKSQLILVSILLCGGLAIAGWMFIITNVYTNLHPISATSLYK